MNTKIMAPIKGVILITLKNHDYISLRINNI